MQNREDASFCQSCGAANSASSLENPPKMYHPSEVAQIPNAFKVQLPLSASPGQIMQVVVPPGYAQEGRLAQVRYTAFACLDKVFFCTIHCIFSMTFVSLGRGAFPRRITT